MPIPYYYTQLSDAQKSAYTTVLDGLRKHSAQITLAPMSVESVQRVWDAVRFDNPMLFYVRAFDHVAYGSTKSAVRPVYTHTPQAAAGFLERIRQYMQVFDAVRHESDADRELRIHDHVLKHFAYDYSFGEHAHSVLGPVLHGTAVCEGIAKFVKLACDRVGLKCLVAVGEAVHPTKGKPEPHAWNVVKIARDSFHLDVTFDMCLTGAHFRYDYFNLCDDDIRRDHVIAGSLPPCSAVGGDYYSQAAQVAGSPAEFADYITKSLRTGSRCVVCKLLNVPPAQDISAKVVQIAGECYRAAVNANARIELSINKAQQVYQINYMDVI